MYSFEHIHNTPFDPEGPEQILPPVSYGQQGSLYTFSKVFLNGKCTGCNFISSNR